jgi:hypothetical protein
MASIRILSDGRRVVRTSIDLDEDVYHTVKEMRLPVSSLVNSALLDYFGAASIDQDIARMRGIRESVAKVCEIDRLKVANHEKREALAATAVKNRVGAVIEAEKAEAIATAVAEDELISHHETLCRAWSLLIKKKKIIPSGLFRRLPENDIDMDHTDFWPALAQEVSTVAGERYTEQEVISYARAQVATC